MKINEVHIKNFRKLKSCRIEFDEQQTILVGANNSGKTSAISAMVWFLSNGKKKFSTREFTLTNWNAINEIGNEWLGEDTIKDSLLQLDKWEDLLPSLDVWLDVKEEETYLINHIIPSLEWEGGMVGFRVRFEPLNLKNLCVDFKEATSKVNKLKDTAGWQKIGDLELFPKNLWDFLNFGNNLTTYFGFKYYILDPTKKQANSECIQTTPNIGYDEDFAKDLIQIDSILAFREFSDPEGAADNEIDTLSKQLQEYYRIKNTEDVDIESADLELISKLHEANKSYDCKLQKSFEQPISALSSINYPGFQNPNICIQSKIDIANAITHESAVQFTLDKSKNLSLPEKYNGLGYRNLISMYFRLIQFREKWLEPLKSENGIVPKIHLVFIEEPEAHLHAQAQQVFIRKALMVLNDDKVITEHSLSTQLVISTHSNHIVNELDMNTLRYFKRIVDPNIHIPVSTVVNLSGIFGEDVETRKFVTRYIKLTHCDIFFADAVILVEGAAERILMSHFLQLECLDTNYIAVIEINGSHAHRFRLLVEKLGIATLVITDIDAVGPTDEKKSLSSVIVEKGKGYTTNNHTIKNWIPQLDAIDDLLDLSAEAKIIDNVRIAYQTQIKVRWREEDSETVIYPCTFEDALIFTNLHLFIGEKIRAMGTATTIYNDCKKGTTAKNLQEQIIKHLNSKYCNKAELAISLLYEDVFDKIVVPTYISDGLRWLKMKLNNDAAN